MSISDIFQKFSYYLTFPFVRYAIIVGILIAFCSALLGVTLVLKRYSFIGDGLSHVAFGSMAIATVIKLTNIYYLVMPITIVAAVLMLCAGNNAKVKGDAVIAIVPLFLVRYLYLHFQVEKSGSVWLYVYLYLWYIFLCTTGYLRLHLMRISWQQWE